MHPLPPPPHVVYTLVAIHACVVYASTIVLHSSRVLVLRGTPSRGCLSRDCPSRVARFSSTCTPILHSTPMGVRVYVSVALVGAEHAGGASALEDVLDLRRVLGRLHGFVVRRGQCRLFCVQRVVAFAGVVGVGARDTCMCLGGSMGGGGEVSGVALPITVTHSSYEALAGGHRVACACCVSLCKVSNLSPPPPSASPGGFLGG